MLNLATLPQVDQSNSLLQDFEPTAQQDYKVISWGENEELEPAGRKTGEEFDLHREREGS